MFSGQDNSSDDGDGSTDSSQEYDHRISSFIETLFDFFSADGDRKFTDFVYMLTPKSTAARDFRERIEVYKVQYSAREELTLEIQDEVVETLFQYMVSDYA